MYELAGAFVGHDVKATGGFKKGQGGTLVICLEDTDQKLMNLLVALVPKCLRGIQERRPSNFTMCPNRRLIVDLLGTATGGSNTGRGSKTGRGGNPVLGTWDLVGKSRGLKGNQRR